MPTDSDPIEATATVLDPPETLVADEAAAIEPAQPLAGQLMDPTQLGTPTTAVGSAVPGLSVIPAETEMRALAQLANTLAFADACPRPLRRKGNDVFLVLLTARDLGTAITTALREFHVIEGRVTLSPKVKLAMVRSRPDLGRVRPAPDNDAMGATWFSIRADGGGVEVASSFSWDDAQLAGLVDSRCTPYEHWKGNDRGSGRNSADCLCKDNWKRYPKRMVSWRALGYLLDDEYPEIGTGLYSPDELGAVTDADGEPIEVTAVAALPGMKSGNRQGGNEPEAPADPAKIAELKARLAQVKTKPEAHEGLKSWWVAQELPQVDQLPARRVQLVEARLAHVESQHGIERPPAGGEEEAAPESPQETPEPPAQVSEPTEPAPEPQGGQEDPPEPVQLATAEALEDEITGGTGQRPTDDPATWVPSSPTDGDVIAWIIQRANAMNGPSIKTSYTVAGLTPPNGNVQGLRKAWAGWQLDLIGQAVANVLALAFLGGYPVEAQA